MPRSAVAQASLDRAIEAALAPPGRVTLALLAGADGRRYVLQIHPLAGHTRDIFHSAAALAVLIERDRPRTRRRATPSAIGELFGLTDREADVASLLTDGLEIAAVAHELKISPETARTYLKYAFEKIGVKRQAEMVALLSRLRP